MMINPQVYKDLTFKINGGSRYPAAMAFLHERLTRSHQPMLVAAEMTSYLRFTPNRAAVQKGRRLWFSAWEPTNNGIAVPSKYARSVEFILPDSEGASANERGNALRLLAGQPDPNDESRFVIPFVIDGKPGEIVCKLTDTGFTIIPSIGKATFGSDDVIRWELLEKPEPSTAPATHK
jgi:hypothetical protein